LLKIGVFWLLNGLGPKRHVVKSAKNLLDCRFFSRSGRKIFVGTRVSRDICLKRIETKYLPFEANSRFSYSLQKIVNIRLSAILRIKNLHANMKEKYEKSLRSNVLG